MTVNFYFLLAVLKIILIFASASSEGGLTGPLQKLPGAVVQLVRMPACHAGGREFESLPHRKQPFQILEGLFFFAAPGLIAINRYINEQGLFVSLYREKSNIMKKSYKIDVDCANCANLVEAEIKKVPGIKDANVVFMTQKMKIEFEDDADPEAVMATALKAAKKVEPDFEILD